MYAGQHLIDPGQVSAITSQIKKNYDDGKGHRHVDIRPSLLAGMVSFNYIISIAASGMRRWLTPLYRIRLRVVPSHQPFFYQIQASGLVNCAVGIENQTPCMLNDRLLPDIIDPSQKISMETTVEQLKKELAAKDLHIQSLQVTSDTVNKKIVVKNSQIQSLQVASDTVKTLEAEISKLKQDVQAKDAQIKNVKPFTPAVITPTARFVLSNLETAANRIPDSLHYNWNGMRVAFVNRKSHRVIDWGRGATAYLYPDAIYNFGNHTVTLKQEGNPAEPDPIFWWSLLVLSGKVSYRKSLLLRFLH